MSEAPSTICPYCGALPPEGPVCAHCGGLLDPASRAATAAEIGPWSVRDVSRPFFPGCSLARLKRMIRDGQLHRETVIRGPTTGGFWMIAEEVPGIARLLGCCHKCGTSVDTTEQSCSRCSAALSIEHQATPAPPGARGGDAASAIDLIKHAQYRRIERLQSFVRLQAVGLAVLGGGIFVGLVVVITGLLDEQPPPVQSEIVPTASEVVPAVTANASPPSATTKVQQTPPPSTPGIETSTNDGMQDSVAAHEALENIRRTMSKVTPEQAELLRRLRALLQNSDLSSSPYEQRTEAIGDARKLINDALVSEDDEFFRLRLQALHGEFDKSQARLDAEAAMGS